MYNILHKYKQAIISILKGLFVFLAFFYIINKLGSNSQLNFTNFKLHLFIVFYKTPFLFLAIALLSALNWSLEITKWQLLVSSLQKITFEEAAIQTLASHTIGFTTPNKIGEYGAKALFFEKKFQKKIIALNFLGNSAQLLVTLLFGTFGIVYLVSNFTIPPLIFSYSKLQIFMGFLLIFCLHFFKNNLIKWFLKLKLYLQSLSKKTYSSVLLLSVLRYIIFTHQFYFFFKVFGIEVPYFSSILLLFCMYFLASVIPTISLFDWAIKGSIAVFLFGLIGVSALPILIITTSMWFLNFAIPALVGGVFVIKFKPIIT